MKQTLRDLAEKLGCHLLGDSSITVTNVSSLQSATSESLVFVEDAQHLDAAIAHPRAVIAQELRETSPPASPPSPS
jgi:UDP-3-O-[3-hydroxymyristoyl] glucosamine N-acyltransferase